MGKKFVLIGAGSYVFTRNLVRDILSFPAFQDATIALVDIDDHGLAFSRKAVQGIIDAGNYPATNGCGDTFHGAFVAGKIYGMDNDAACQYASAAAALKCTRLGARSAMATDEECREFLRKQP